MLLFICSVVLTFAAILAWIKHSACDESRQAIVRRWAISFTATAPLLLLLGVLWIAAEKRWGLEQEIRWRVADS
jgi:hypothetical protein